MTSSIGNIFRVTGHLRGEFTGHRWIPRTKASDAELWCILWCAPDKRLSKQSWAGDLRRHRAHYDVTVIYHDIWYSMTKKWRNSRIYIYKSHNAPVHYPIMHHLVTEIFLCFRCSCTYSTQPPPSTRSPAPSTQHPLRTDVYHACTHFRENRSIFSLGGAHSWNPKEKV